MTAGIVVRDSVAYLEIEDPELLERLVEATSFKLEGADFLRGPKDKRTKLIRNSKAPVGLLDRICRTIEVEGARPTVTYADTVQAPKPRVSLQIVGVTPRDYQLEAELAATVSDRGIFRMPTGSGKTLVSAMAIAARGYHAVMIVPTIDLLRQTRDYLSEHLVLAPTETQLVGVFRIGQLGDGVVNPQPVTVATMRSMAKALDVAYQSYEFGEYDDTDETQIDPRAMREWVQSIGMVVVDEAHQLGAKTLYETTTKIPAICKYGNSASPWRDDGADLMIEAATGPPIYHIPAERLVRQGYLMAPEFWVVDTSKWWHGAAWGRVCANKRCRKQWLTWTSRCDCGSRSFRSQFNEAYKDEIVENPIRNTHIAQLVGELVDSGHTTLVLVKQVKHGRELAERIPGSVFLSGLDRGAARQDALDALRNGVLRVAVLTTIGDMGLDIPNLSALVLAGGGKSSTRHLQRIGRVVRPWPDKPRPIVVDLDDTHVAPWFGRHAQRRRKIEEAEWRQAGATWLAK